MAIVKAAAVPAPEAPAKKAAKKAPAGKGTMPKAAKKLVKTVKKAKAAKKKTEGTVRQVGVQCGGGVHAAWMFILQANETIAGGTMVKLHGKNRSKPLTDPEIAEWMYAEFPGRETAAFKNVSAARWKYNQGGFGDIGKVVSHNHTPNTGIDPKAAASAKAPVKKVTKKAKKA